MQLKTTPEEPEKIVAEEETLVDDEAVAAPIEETADAAEEPKPELEEEDLEAKAVASSYKCCGIF